MNIQDALKQLRRELKINQSELAQLLHVSHITVNRWENGKNSPNQAALKTILSVAIEQGVSNVCMATLQEAIFPSAEEIGLNDLKFAEINLINQMLNDSSNAVVVCDKETHEILYLNQQAAQIAGRTIEEAKVNTCYQYLLHRDTPCDTCDLAHASADAYSIFNFSSPRTGRHYLMRGKLITWKNRTACIEYITDTTELYRAKEELEERQQIFLEASRFANLWIFKYDIQADCIHTGRKLQEEFGCPEIVSDFSSLLPQGSELHPESHEEFFNLMDCARKGIKQAETEVQVRLADGELHWLRARMNVIRYDEAGQPTLAVCSVQRMHTENCFAIDGCASGKNML